jgi:hypothetical protein
VSAPRGYPPGRSSHSRLLIARTQEVHDHVIQVVEEPVVHPPPGGGIGPATADPRVRRAIRMHRRSRQEDFSAITTVWPRTSVRGLDGEPPTSHVSAISDRPDRADARGWGTFVPSEPHTGVCGHPIGDRPPRWRSPRSPDFRPSALERFPQGRDSEPSWPREEPGDLGRSPAGGPLGSVRPAYRRTRRPARRPRSPVEKMSARSWSAAITIRETAARGRREQSAPGGAAP